MSNIAITEDGFLTLEVLTGGAVKSAVLGRLTGKAAVLVEMWLEDDQPKVHIITAGVPAEMTLTLLDQAAGALNEAHDTAEVNVSA